jgi:hypothetical protein
MIHIILAISMFALILVRCAVVVNEMSFKGRNRSWVTWELFSGAYCLLVFSAGCSAYLLVTGYGTYRDWAWLMASTGLIVFDRRRRRNDDAKSEGIPRHAGV